MTSLVDVPEDMAEFNDWAVEQRWSDGLPMIPPTEDRVDEMLTGTGWPSDEVIGKIPARLAEATVEIIAANAVMAGCTPAAMPILITAVQAMIDPIVNLYGAQATTHPCALMVLVSGPLTKSAGIHSGSGLFGPGFRGNATIGRAVRLIQQNVGGAWPGETDRATQGTSAKFSFCFAENDEESPWEPYRVSQGYQRDDTTVTVVAAEGPHNLNDHVSKDPKGILAMFRHTIATMGKNNSYIMSGDYVVVVCPEHATTLHDGGFERRDVQEFLHNRARIPYRDWKLGGMIGMLNQPKYLDAADDDFPVPITTTPDDVHIVVGGGPGLHSTFIPTFGLSRTATRVV
ncbi:MAG: hypothetical protein QOG64_2107, partial [Acidimicrobiaceae bacterium]|nr:hypothetical protein [Acidimicrobiaceae bacterium]